MEPGFKKPCFSLFGIWKRMEIGKEEWNTGERNMPKTEN